MSTQSVPSNSPQFSMVEEATSLNVFAAQVSAPSQHNCQVVFNWKLVVAAFKTFETKLLSWLQQDSWDLFYRQ